MPIIFHVTTKSDWAKAQQDGEYIHPSLAAEGFIHCSQEHQVEGVLQRYYAGVKELIQLHIDTNLLKSAVVFDWSPSTADTFPHVYGPINLDAVINVTDLVS
jgi:uncharacterized protein (DUF952 family)